MRSLRALGLNSQHRLSFCISLWRVFFLVSHFIHPEKQSIHLFYFIHSYFHSLTHPTRLHSITVPFYAGWWMELNQSLLFQKSISWLKWECKWIWHFPRQRVWLKRDRVEVKRTSRDHKTSRVKVNEELNCLNANPINLAMAVDVIIVNGRVNGRPARLMIDSGASGCFVKKAFVERNNLDTKEIDQRNIRLANGQIITTNRLLPEASIR